MNKAVKSLFPALTAAHATALPADAGAGSEGKWVMLLPTGSFAGRDGRGPYDAGGADGLKQVVAATLKRAGNTDIVIDYDHQTVFSAIPGVGGRAPAAGWIKKFEIRDDGLWGFVEWTEAAAQSIRASEYRYISPVYQHTKAGKVMVLISAALTNTPNLDLAAVAASADLNQQEQEMDKILAALGLPQGAGEDAVLTAINTVLASSTAVAVALGLDKTSKPDAVAAAVAAMRADVDKVTTAAGLAKGAKADDVVTAIQSAKAGAVDPTKFVPIEQVTAMQADIKNLNARLADDDAEDAVADAIKDGKLAPALKDWGIALHKADPAKFNDFVGKAPVLTSAQRSTVTPPAAGDAALDDADLAVMSQLGLTREAMIKSKKGGEA